MSRVVHLHIGAPKTGTTYVQDRLQLNKRALAEHGVDVTSPRLVESSLFQFRAALDLLGQDWGGHTGHADGAWDKLVKLVHRHQGNSVISHEILAPAKPEIVARVMRDLRGCDVHVVYSARDLGRQLPAAWQESIKQGRKWSFNRFLNRVEKGYPWFYRAFDLPNVLNIWGEHLPPERVHVVTVPHGRSDELWLRMCRALQFDPAWAPEESHATNASLGVPEVQLMRMLNRRMDRATRREAEYDELLRELLAQNALAQRSGERVELPPERRSWAEEQTEHWIAWLARNPVDLIGDVEELRPAPVPEKWNNPDKVAPRKVLAAAMDALVAITHEAASRPDPEQQFGARIKRVSEKLRSK